jgi:hypothetical protein
MVKRDENPWQFKFSLALAILMLFLVFGYFTQSFLEIRKVKPVSVAIERLSNSNSGSTVAPMDVPITEKVDKETAEQ